MVTREKTDGQRTVPRKKGRKRKFRIVLFWIKLALVSGLVAGIFTLLALSSAFNVNRYIVEGSSHYEKENIIARSGILLGVNGFRNVSGKPLQILTLRSGKAEKAILASCPYLKTATVRFILPDTVKIVLEDRKPAFIVPYYGTSLVLDAEGYVVEASKEVLNLKLPKAEGLKIDSFGLGKCIDACNKEKLAKAAAVIKAVDNSDKGAGNKISGFLEGINISDISNVTILLDSRISVNLGDLTELDYRLIVTKQVFFQHIKKGDKGFLDFTAGQNAIFKPQTEINSTQNNMEDQK